MVHKKIKRNIIGKNRRGVLILKEAYKQWRGTSYPTKRGLHAFIIDKSKRGKIPKRGTPTQRFLRWRNNPRKWDWEGIDTPSGASHYIRKGKGSARVYSTAYRNKFWKRKTRRKKK